MASSIVAPTRSDLAALRLFERLDGWGDHPAIVRDDGVWSYAWLVGRAAWWQRRFEELDGPVASVSVEADHGPESCAVLLALLARGAVIVPLGDTMPAATADTLRAVASVGVRVIGPEPLRVEVHERAVEHPLLVSRIARRRGTIVLFTTGSTGTARAAAHDAVRFLEKFRVPGPRLPTCAFLLFDHIGGQNTLFHTLASGGSPVCPAARDAETVCAAIARHGVELLPTSPTFLNLMLLGGAHRRHDLRSLRLVSYGTEPMPASTLAALGAALPEVRFKQTYGLSEVGILRTQSRADDSLWMRVGGPEYETRVVEGTLRVRPRHGMLGYLNAPSPFDADGWLDTGDVVIEDGDWLHIVGRRRDEINVGGLKVHPVEVESVLLGLPGVIDATVRGVAHPLTGQVVVARVTLAEQDSGDDPGPEVRRRLRRACAARLAPHMVPARFEFAAGPQHSARFKLQRPDDEAAEPIPAPALRLPADAPTPARRLDALRDRYLEPTPDRRVDQHFTRLLADALVPDIRGPRMLELGVGDQMWTPRLCAALADVTTVEGSTALLEAMRGRPLVRRRRQLRGGHVRSVQLPGGRPGETRRSGRARRPQGAARSRPRVARGRATPLDVHDTDARGCATLMPVEWSETTWVVSVAAVAVSGLVAWTEGLWRRRPGLDIGFVNHGGMWGDALLLPIANAAIVPWVAPGWWLGAPLALAAGASVAVHVWWHGGVPAGVRDHMWPARLTGHWATDLSWAGWCHVAYVAGELGLVLAYAASAVPADVVLVVTAVLSVHVPLGLLQPAWFATGRVFPAGLRLMAASLAAVWVTAAAKMIGARGSEVLVF